MEFGPRRTWGNDRPGHPAAGQSSVNPTAEERTLAGRVQIAPALAASSTAASGLHHGVQQGRMSEWVYSASGEAGDHDHACPGPHPRNHRAGLSDRLAHQAMDQWRIVLSRAVTTFTVPHVGAPSSRMSGKSLSTRGVHIFLHADLDRCTLDRLLPEMLHRAVRLIWISPDV